MYAVIKSGGKQYRVQAGQTVKVEKLAVTEGASVAIEEVLLFADGEQLIVGDPYVKGVTVETTVKSHGRAPKVGIVKFRRRKHYRKQMGHRQSYTELRIDAINTANPTP